MNEEGVNLFSQDVIEFVTVATEFCVRAENVGQTTRKEFVGVMLKILPLLYLKGIVLTETVPVEEEDSPEQLVTEDDYNFVRDSIAAQMGSFDDYLDVFVEDMKYSDSPIRKTISEDLADIYQDLRNFVGIFKEGHEESVRCALQEVKEQFPNYWGQRIPCVMRALHDVMYVQQEDGYDN